MKTINATKSECKFYPRPWDPSTDFRTQIAEGKTSTDLWIPWCMVLVNGKLFSVGIPERDMTSTNLISKQLIRGKVSFWGCWRRGAWQGDVTRKRRLELSDVELNLKWLEAFRNIIYYLNKREASRDPQKRRANWLENCENKHSSFKVIINHQMAMKLISSKIPSLVIVRFKIFWQKIQRKPGL